MYILGEKKITKLNHAKPKACVSCGKALFFVAEITDTSP